jgi:hypothetical protein
MNLINPGIQPRIFFFQLKNQLKRKIGYLVTCLKLFEGCYKKTGSSNFFFEMKKEVQGDTDTASTAMRMIMR